MYGCVGLDDCASVRAEDAYGNGGRRGYVMSAGGIRVSLRETGTLCILKAARL